MLPASRMPGKDFAENKETRSASLPLRAKWENMSPEKIIGFPTVPEPPGNKSRRQ